MTFCKKENKLRIRCSFVLVSLGCLVVSLFAYATGIIAFALANNEDSNFLRLIPTALTIGFWAAPVGIIIAIVGIFARHDKKWACLIPLVLNLLVVLAAFGVLAIGAILVGGN